MSTRRQRELRLTSDQAEYVRKSIEATISLVVLNYRAKSTTYEGREHDQEIVDQVLRGIIYELRRGLGDTLDRITKRFIP